MRTDAKPEVQDGGQLALLSYCSLPFLASITLSLADLTVQFIGAPHFNKLLAKPENLGH